jgi:NADH-quinone oxidoreductase subunit E
MGSDRSSTATDTKVPLGGIISSLQEIQAKHGYLSEESLRALAEATKRPLADIYGVATFYKSFSLKPRGKHLILACLGTACHVRSAPMIAEEFERQLGVHAGGTTGDREFTLETVNCLGACALGPIVMVDGHYFSGVSTSMVKKIIKSTRAGLDTFTERDANVIPLTVSCPRCNHRLMDETHLIDDHPSIRMTASFDRKHGWIRLSSLYGSYNNQSEYEIPMDTIIHFFCPHCHAELGIASNCLSCSAPLVPMIVTGGGMVQICSRHGCRSHMLDVEGVNL